MKFLTFLLVFAVLAGVTPVYGTINVDIYSGYIDHVTSIEFSGLVDSFTSDNVLFGLDSGYDWHPSSLSAFAADITGFIHAESDTTLPFTLYSDDGSCLFIDGVLAVNNGGPHGLTPVTENVFLSAGIHSFEVQFFEDFGGPSGVDLYFNAEGVRYADAVPEPTTIIVWSLIGVLGMLYGWRNRKA